VEIKHIDVRPSNAKRGDTVHFYADLIIKEEITSGQIWVTVNSGEIPLIDQKLEFCEVLSQTKKSCPVQPGDFQLQQASSIPIYMPSGLYKGKGILYDQNQQEILCIDLFLKV
jgi:hypothetical protein